MSSQEFDRELRERKYSCNFCDSIQRRLDVAADSELEMLFIEHIRAYHGLFK